MIIKNEQSNFSIKARLRSFRFAFEGLNSFFATQHNATIHLVMTILVIGAALFFKVTGRGYCYYTGYWSRVDS